MIKPLKQRRFDLFLVVFFVMHILATAIVDSQVGEAVSIWAKLLRLDARRRRPPSTDSTGVVQYRIS